MPLNYLGFILRFQDVRAELPDGRIRLRLSVTGAC